MHSAPRRIASLVALLFCFACSPPPETPTDLAEIETDLATADTAASVDMAAMPTPYILALTNTSTVTPPIKMNITQFNWTRQIAVGTNDTIHVAWTQLGAENIEYAADLPDPVNVAGLREGQIFYKRSVDDGQTWSSEVALTARQAGIDSANIAVSGDNVYAIWRQEDAGRLRVFFRRSLDGGLNWDSPLAISDNPTGISVSPPALATSISPLNNSVYVVWADGREQNVSGQSDYTKEVFLKSTDDKGASWNPGRLVSSLDAFSSWTPAVAVAGDVVHVGWTDERHNLGDCTTTANACKEEEYYRRSVDKGVTWGPEVRLTVDPPGALAISWAPSLAAWGNVVHFSYLDKRTGVFQNYYRRSLDGGNTWQPETLLPGGPFANAARPTIFAHGINVHLAWFGFDDFEADIFYARSTDDGATWSNPINLTATEEGAARIPSIAAGPTGAHMVWYDTRGSGPGIGQKIEIYYARPGG